MDNYFGKKEIAKIKGLIPELFRYGVTMVISQLIIIAAMYLAVDILAINEKLAYAVVITLIYVGVYYSYTRYVFKKSHSTKKLFRFTHVLIFSWVGNNVLFYLLTNNFHIHYAVASICNTLILGGVRFALNKYYVFAD
jgi:putative flippase GtrA